MLQNVHFFAKIIVDTPRASTAKFVICSFAQAQLYGYEYRISGSFCTSQLFLLLLFIRRASTVKLGISRKKSTLRIKKLSCAAGWSDRRIWIVQAFLDFRWRWKFFQRRPPPAGFMRYQASTCNILGGFLSSSSRAC